MTGVGPRSLTPTHEDMFQDDDLPPTASDANAVSGASLGPSGQSASGVSSGDNMMTDFENQILQQFSCMNTNDRDSLVREFQKLLGQSINPEMCIFFLEMNNWNLQAAVCAYFDCDAHRLDFRTIPSMSFVRDVTIGEGEEVSPRTRFTKTWRIQNSGPERWPAGCYLQFLSGDQMSDTARVIADPLSPSETTDISISMMSPDAQGTYQGQWRMATPTGQFFGVSEGGLLGLTQQMDETRMMDEGDGDNDGAHVQNSCMNGNNFSPPLSANPFSIRRSAMESNHQNSIFVNSTSTNVPLSASPSNSHYQQQSMMNNQTPNHSQLAQLQSNLPPVLPTNALNGFSHLLKGATASQPINAVNNNHRTPDAPSSIWSIPTVRVTNHDEEQKLLQASNLSPFGTIDETNENQMQES